MSKILITGASGFLGSSIVSEFKKLHHNITTIGISNIDDIYCNLAKTIPEINSDFELVIHVAGKAHVTPKDSKDIADFYHINLNGTKNLLKGIEYSGNFPQSIIFISTVAVYGLEKGEMITENHKRNATDPYGKSKLQAEDYLLEWGTKNNVKIGIIRPPLIVGLNAPGNLGSMIKGIKSGHYINIDKGKARRSMVLATDLASFLPIIAKHGGIYHLTDGQHPSFGEISHLIAAKYGNTRILNLPLSIAIIISKVCDFLQKLIVKDLPFNSRKLIKMTSTLTFDDSKAKKIGWEPRSVVSNYNLWLD